MYVRTSVQAVYRIQIQIQIHTAFHVMTSARRFYILRMVHQGKQKQDKKKKRPGEKGSQINLLFCRIPWIDK